MRKKVRAPRNLTAEQILSPPEAYDLLTIWARDSTLHDTNRKRIEAWRKRNPRQELTVSIVAQIAREPRFNIQVPENINTDIAVPLTGVGARALAGSTSTYGSVQDPVTELELCQQKVARLEQENAELKKNIEHRRKSGRRI